MGTGLYILQLIMQAAKSYLFLAFLILASSQGIAPIPAPGAASSTTTGSDPGSTTTTSFGAKTSTSFTSFTPPTPKTLPSLPSAAKGCCVNGCQDICAVSFRLPETDFYLTTVNGNYLQFQTAALPNPVATPNQQFILTRNPDCTWSIRSKSSGQYISTSNSNGGNWLSFKPLVGMAEKWYLESHEDHIHVQSASAVKSYWQFDSSYALNIIRGKASVYKMQFFPCDFQFGWN